MPSWSKSLFGQVCIALVLGTIVGFAMPDLAAQMKPLGDGFIKLIKMLIPAIVFCVVVHGIAGAGDLKKVGRVGVRAIIYFEVITTIALILGVVLAYVFQPGAGMNIDISTLDASALNAYVERAHEVSDGGTVAFLMKLIPTTIFSGFVTGDVLQVLLVAILFGCALAMLGERGKPILNMIELTSDTIFKIMSFIVRLAPLGVFGAIAYTVGSYGIGSLAQLGIKDSTVGLVVPTGYSFNLDAFSIYLTLAALFIAQATNTDLAFMDLLVILGVALITSKGAHGVPGSAIVILAATLTAVPAIPAIGLVLVLSVDWFMGIARALGNYLGNCVATIAVASWVEDIDRVRAHQILDGKDSGPLLGQDAEAL